MRGADVLRSAAVLLLVFAAALPVAAPALAQDLQPVPRLEARVTDLTGTLTAGQQAELEQKLAAFEQRKGSQVALLIVNTTEPEAIEQYSLRVAEAWKLGRAKPDDGVLLLVAMQDRTLRIEVGYGLEGAHTGRARAPHHRRHHHAAVPAGRLLRRRQCGSDADLPPGRWRSAAAAGPQLAKPRRLAVGPAAVAVLRRADRRRRAARDFWPQPGRCLDRRTHGPAGLGAVAPGCGCGGCRHPRAAVQPVPRHGKHRPQHARRALWPLGRWRLWGWWFRGRRIRRRWRGVSVVAAAVSGAAAPPGAGEPCCAC